MRLIDVDALGVGRCSRDVLPADHCAGWNGVINIIDNAPTVDAVPVVRCKDCKYHREINERECEYLQPDVLICTNAEFIDDGWNPVWPDDFCRYGEYKDKED